MDRYRVNGPLGFLGFTHTLLPDLSTVEMASRKISESMGKSFILSEDYFAAMVLSVTTLSAGAADAAGVYNSPCGSLAPAGFEPCRVKI